MKAAQQQSAKNKRGKEQHLFLPDVFIAKPLDGPWTGPCPRWQTNNLPFTDNCDRCDVSQRLRLMQCPPSPLAFCLLLLCTTFCVAYYCRRAAATSTTTVQVFRAWPAFFLGIEITHHINSIFVPFTGLMRCVWPQIVRNLCDHMRM